MPRDIQYSEAVGKVDECIQACGDELLDTGSESGQTTVWKVKRGDYIYTISRVQNADHFQLSFEYSIIRTVAQILSIEDADTILKAENAPVDDHNEENRRLAAADILLSKTPEGLKAQFTNDLIQLMSHPKLSFEFRYTENESIASFQLNTNIYPYSADFRYKEFDEAVQTVITIGYSASTYSQISLDVQSVVDQHTSKPSMPYVQ